jgi:PAS domain S-box-containing protein
MSAQYQLLEALSAAVYTTDAEGRITFYNAAAAKLWGYEPELGALWCGSWRIYKPNGEVLPHDQCPMAIALREGRTVRGVDAIAERPDGTRVPFMPFPTPLFDADGKLTGAINLLVDLSEAHGLEQDRARLAAIVECSDDAIVGKTLMGVVTSWNTGAERIFGYRADEIVGQHITKIIPPELHAEEEDILGRLSKGERVEHYETQRIAKDGRRVHTSLTVSPIRDSRGAIIGASKVGRDITERRRAEEMQRLLLNELHHRVKNTLATVDAIARQTLRRTSNSADFVASFSGRLKALARAHSLLTDATFQRAEIAELVRDQLTLGLQDDSRIRLSGPRASIAAQAYLHLALVLHELGTNARKYGALSNAKGAVSLEWSIESGEQRVLKFSWRETGGPEVRAPSRAGFGTMLIQQSLKSHGGEAIITYAMSGLTCEISLPLAEEEETPWLPREERGEPKRAVSPVALAPSLAAKRVLVVEDEALIAMVAADYLSDGGCDVVGPAPTIQAALELIASAEIDAALLDGNLGGQRIDDVAAALTRKSIPFALVTGYGREALPKGLQDAITVEKPFSQDDLLGAVKRLLAENSDDKVVALKKKH